MHKILIGAAKNSGKKDFADGVHYGQDEKYEIKVKRQRSAYDCGQTCLEMLGYRDVREMYPIHICCLLRINRLVIIG